MKKWQKQTIKAFVVAFGSTAGIVFILSLTTDISNADEFSHGIPAGLIGTAIGWAVRGILPTHAYYGRR